MTDTKIYLVGGAVRDRLLGIEHLERDWVVTGATPEAMMKKGYRQVGKSFPVFLHPDTGEEYALARTERKAGRGYHGFTVDFGPEVTLPIASKKTLFGFLNLRYFWETGARSALQGNTFVATLTFPIPGIPLQ